MEQQSKNDLIFILTALGAMFAVIVLVIFVLESLK